MKDEPNGKNGGATREELLRENARLRGDLLTVARRICHDLRTPLGGILTTSEVLKETLVDNSPSFSLVAPIFNSAEGMAKLIERMSFVLKASVNPIAKEPVKMGDVVFRALQSLESKILKKNIIVAEPASWPEVSGVAAWLEVVWWNLLANAAQHGKNQIELGWSQEKDGWRFGICDDGDGVPADKRDKLFQPFDLLHGPDATQGLGLSIVQRLVELQGGNCGHELCAEGSARFYFTLPMEITRP